MLVPTLLLILDGWGLAPAGPGNALSLARTPAIDRFLSLPSRTELLCSGRAVGLPDGYMGNSEVGHMNIGAGRVVYQDMTRIDMALENDSFASNPVIRGTLAAAKQHGGVLHLMGLLSDGGVHSHLCHLFALLRAAEKACVPAFVHAFMDGRDTAPDSGLAFMQSLLDNLPPGGRVASVCGRYYAMDRDSRWDRTLRVWSALVHGKAPVFTSPTDAIQVAYDGGETDEFITPRLIAQENGKTRLISDNDALFFFNFRADRARQLSRCFFADAFNEFDRGTRPTLAAFATMTPYEADFTMPAAFTRQSLSYGLGQVVSEAGIRQLRIAETEKYAHVTYFLNGGREEPFPGEERRLIPSPRDVPTYDLKPEMSARQVTDVLIEEWNYGHYGLVVCNLANLDMVGHTGSIPATIKACEVVDACVDRIAKAVLARGGRMVLTADHGNAEEMLTSENHPQTAHSKNPVAFAVAGQTQVKKLGTGKLGDIAPTLLSLWGMPVPPEMTGRPLMEEILP